MKHKKNKAIEYISRFNLKWNNKYKYPKEIHSSTEEIDIECPDHGIFKMQAYRHLNQRCPKCGPRGDSFKTFTEKANIQFNNKFIYIKDTFINAQEKMSIICPIHGEFQQSLVTHIRLAHGCPKCGYESSANHCRDNLDTFIQKAKQVHGDKYDYSKVNYINSTTLIDIYCNKHKKYFKIQPASHIRGRGCKLCGFESSAELRSYTQKEFIEKVKSIQGDEYDLSELEYINFDTKVKLICKEHGPFYKNPGDLISKKTGCPKCAGNYIYTTEEYIQKAKQVHGDKYDYSKTKYIRAQDKVIITCPTHGDFEQVASGHIACKYGCPKCVASKGEIYIHEYLKKYNIKHETEYKLLGNKYKYDFYLNDYHIFIEFHGKQHYEYNHFFHKTYNEFINRKIVDDIKAEVVKANNGKLIVIPYSMLEQGTIDRYLKRSLIRHGIPLTVFEI